jgi:hypothetical protein
MTSDMTWHGCDPSVRPLMTGIDADSASSMSLSGALVRSMIASA